MSRQTFTTSRAVSIWSPPVRRLGRSGSRTGNRVRYEPANEGDEAMRFLSMIRVNENTGQKPSERLMTEMGKLIDEMTKEGTLVRTAGLRPTKEGFRVRSRHGKVSATDGPFTESKEVIGGYAVLEARSKEHAIELTTRFLAVHGDEWDLECEVRPLDGQE